MADYQLTQSGAQVQSILDKADKLPATVGTNGQVLTSNGTDLSWQSSSGGTKLYKHFMKFSNSLADDQTCLIIISSRQTSYTLDELRDMGNFNCMGDYYGNSNIVNAFAFIDDIDNSTRDSIFISFAIHKSNDVYTFEGYRIKDITFMSSSTPTFESYSETITTSNYSDTVTAL